VCTGHTGYSESMEPNAGQATADLAAARALLPRDAAPIVVIQPGGRDPRPRWPTDRFAEVASRCARGGALVVLVGTAAESALLNDIWRQADRRLSWGAADVVIVRDSIDISAWRGLLALSDVVVGNDDGVLHLARSEGTPTITISGLDMTPDQVVGKVSELLASRSSARSGRGG
jgi:ADP-heptose:LPS heptosyltransferase